MERIKHIERLLDSYFEAQATPEEERELREFFTSGQTIPAYLEYARAMFGGMDALREEVAPDGCAQIYGVASESCSQRNEPRSVPESGAQAQAPHTPRMRYSHGGARRLRLWAAGIAAAGLAVGLFALVSYLNRPYCYIDGVPVRDAELAMQATVYFEQLEALDKPIERLDGILDQLKNDKR